jgi:hypothetical protein
MRDPSGDAVGEGEHDALTADRPALGAGRHRLHVEIEPSEEPHFTDGQLEQR